MERLDESVLQFGTGFGHQGLRHILELRDVKWCFRGATRELLGIVHRLGTSKVQDFKELHSDAKSTSETPITPQWNSLMDG